MVLNIPRILEYSWSTFDFFETAYCAIIHEDEIQIEPIDVFAFFLLDEIGMGTFADYHDYLAMLPKGTDRYQNFVTHVTKNFRCQFQPKNSGTHFNQSFRFPKYPKQKFRYRCYRKYRYSKFRNPKFYNPY